MGNRQDLRERRGCDTNHTAVPTAQASRDAPGGLSFALSDDLPVEYGIRWKEMDGNIRLLSLRWKNRNDAIEYAKQHLSGGFELFQESAL